MSAGMNSYADSPLPWGICAASALRALKSAGRLRLCVLWLFGGRVPFLIRQKKPEQLLQPGDLPTICPVRNNVSQCDFALW